MNLTVVSAGAWCLPGLLILALGGCATRTAAVINPVEAASPDQAATALPDIADLARGLTRHPRALWQSQSARYEYFIGGVLQARYAPGEQLLTLLDASHARAGLVCHFDFANNLTTETPQRIKATQAEQFCGELIRELHGALTR